ncbi:MAG: hypothetical protein KKD18_03515 [Nanoarchaeota archaeon]|nr:hypothetical protein [Nanoarchaeota archaeon]
MSVDIKKTGSAVIVAINARERLNHNLVFLVLTSVFLLLIFFVSFWVFNSVSPILYVVALALVVINVIRFRIRFFIEKDLSQQSFRIVMPVSFFLSHRSIFAYGNREYRISECLKSIEALTARGYFSFHRKIFTLQLVFDTREIVLFSPKEFAQNAKVGSTFLYRVTKEEAETIAKELGVKVNWDEA